MAYLSFVSSTETSITVRLMDMNSFTGTRYYAFSKNGVNWESESGSGTYTQHTYTLEGLTPGTSYTIHGKFRRSDIPDKEYEYTVSASTKSETISFTVTASTENTLSTRLSTFSGIQGSRSIDFYANGTYKGNYLALGTEQVIDWDFTGLTAGTEYTLTAEMNVVGQSRTYTYTAYGRTAYPTSDDATLYGNGYGDYFSVMLSGITKRNYPRFGAFAIGSYTKSVSIPANQTYATATIYGTFNEGQNYTLSAFIRNPDDVNTWSQSKTVNSGYEQTVTLSVTSSTESTISLSANIATASASHPRSYRFKCNGQILTGEGATGTITYGKTVNCVVEGLMPGKTYEFSIEVTVSSVTYSATASGSTTAPTAEISIASYNEYSATAKLSNLTANVGYDRKVKWYYKKGSEGTFTYAGETSISRAATEATKLIDVFASATSYNIKAELYSGNELLLTKTTSVTTLQTPASIRAGSRTSTTIKVYVEDLEPTSYERKFDWYYKRHAESTFTYGDTTTYSAGKLEGNTQEKFQGLLSDTSYDFKVDIKKGDLILRTLTLNNISTLVDTSDYPHPDIDSIEEQTGIKTITVTWSAPDHQLGFSYRVEYSTDDETFTTLINNLTQPGTYSGTLPNFNTTYYIRVKAWKTVGGIEVANYSDSETVYIYSAFAWDTTKIQGQPFALTASEWQRFCTLLLRKYDDVHEERSLAAQTLQSMFGGFIPDYDFTAGAANIAKDVLIEMGAFTENEAPANVAKTDPVPASYLNAFQSAINRI